MRHPKFKTVVPFGKVLDLRAERLNSQSSSALSSWVTLAELLPLSEPQSPWSASSQLTKPASKHLPALKSQASMRYSHCSVLRGRRRI